MNATDRKLNKLNRRAKHLEELRAIGYKGNTLIALKRIENTMHRYAEAYCNGEMTETEYSDAEMRMSNRVASLFGGTLPKGFFINGDPRGYALKLDDEAYKTDLGRGEMPITYKDWGGYMILAPDDL